MQLQTNRLMLSGVLIDDLNHIHQLHSLPEVDEFNTLGIPASVQVTKDLIQIWLNNQQADPRLSYIFTIRLTDPSEFIGLIGLNISPKLNYRLAEVWYKTHPDHWKKGYTTEALKRILQFGFHDLQLHRIEAGCAVDNLASVRVLEKAGMTREGRKRSLLPIRGKWVDNYVYSILEKEVEKP